METTQVIDWSRAALQMALLLGGPLLGVALLVGLVIGVLQTMTQMHEQVVAQVPRLIAVVLAMLVILPWLISRWVAYASETIGSIPELI
jgi:flagellar biosynthetic protein FliQ